MEELLFGTLATDDLKLVNHRARQRGLQHAHALAPRDPLPGQPVTIRVTVGPDLPAEHVACYYTVDGSEPLGERGVAHNGHVLLLKQRSVAWDTFCWGYLAHWEGVLPPQPEGTTVRYRIGAWAEGKPEVFADWPEVKRTVEDAAKAFFRQQPLPAMRTPGDPTRGNTFILRFDHLGPPQWAREAVIYHIFVDRFYPGRGRDWLQTSDLRGFCGGTLWGVAEKMDYIAELGATCIWLSPVMPSPTPHGYDATDYEHVEPRLGGDEALREVVAAAHGRGMRVVLDLACNHLSHLHPFFQEAQANPSSPYRQWFLYDDSENGYRSFFGVPSMPEINLDHPDARAWMIEIGRYWLREFDIDGYRLDHANGPGPDFWAEFWAACKAEKPDCFCFGEVVEPPDVQQRYIGRLDGLLDFHFADALRRTFGRRTWREEQFEAFLQRHMAFFPPDFLMLTFMDNHDMDRFLFVAEGDKAALRRAAEVMMRLPGPPIIYYGTEVGMSQMVSKSSEVGLEASRMPMLWGHEQDSELLAYFKGLIRQRREALAAQR